MRQHYELPENHLRETVKLKRESVCFITNSWKSMKIRFSDFSTNKILDLGCGEGMLEKECTEVIYGVDLRKVYEGPQGRFVRGNALYLPFKDNTFDLIVEHLFIDDLVVLQHRRNSLAKIFSECWRVLRKNGFFHITSASGCELYMKQSHWQCVYQNDGLESFYQKHVQKVEA